MIIKPNDYVYNCVIQIQAATLARGMYGEDKKFTSDLINSYAWDTVIVFLQTFDNRANTTQPIAILTVYVAVGMAVMTLSWAI